MCLKFCNAKHVKINDCRTILIRRPKMSDLKQLKDYINSLVDEDAPIQVNERLSLKAERSWLKDSLIKIRKNKAHLLVAELDKKIVSVVNLTKGTGRSSHVADYGVSVLKEYRRLGIATAVTKYILTIGKRDKTIKVIMLRVYEKNTGAIKMYKKLGFKKVAKLKKRVKYKGRLVNEFIMDFEG
jgi:ribosomal protein S18 acetylase RimI-like enzyme